MHRIDGPGATIDNHFTDGDPGSSIPATVVTGDWLNAVQDDIANAIEGAGITLSKPSNNQLLLAIQAISGANQGFSTGDVKLTLATTAPAGWLMMDDGTIGDDGSAATSRANADTEGLYTMISNGVGTTNTVGGDGAHNNMQPTAFLNAMVKL